MEQAEYIQNTAFDQVIKPKWCGTEEQEQGESKLVSSKWLEFSFACARIPGNGDLLYKKGGYGNKEANYFNVCGVLSPLLCVWENSVKMGQKLIFKKG